MGNRLDIDLAIRQFRAAPQGGAAGLYDPIVREIERRIPSFRAQARPGLSPAGRKILEQHDDRALTSRLLERVVGWPGRPAAYQPRGSFDTYAITHIQLFIQSELNKQKKWVPLDEAEEVLARPEESPTNTLPMEEIHGVLENKVIQAMDSSNADEKAKILYAMEFMPDGAASPGVLDELCRKAGLSGPETARIITLMGEKPENFEEEVRNILGLTPRAATGRLSTAEPLLAGPWEKARTAARQELEKLRNPTSDPDRDPFFDE